MDFIKRNYIFIFFVVLVLIGFAHNHSVSLWDQDEAAYAGFARKMVETGNWLIPDFMWSDIHRKTPLHFWNIAISYNLFGVNEFSVRFPSTIAVLLTYVLIFFWGGKLFGRNISFLGAFVLSTSLLVPAMAKVSVTDGSLLLFSTVCAFSIIHLFKEKNIWVVVLFWVSFSLALLVKGPPVIIFTGGFGFILAVFHPERKRLVHFHPWFFFPLSVLPLFLWGYLTTLEDGGSLVGFLIDWYILKRIQGSVLGQSGPPGLHLVYLAVSFLPYIIFFPKAIWKGLRGVVKEKDDGLLLGAWLVAGWLIYEFSKSKLPSYCLTAHVPLALLIGKQIEAMRKSNIQQGKGLVALNFSVLLLLSIGLTSVSFYFEMDAYLRSTFILLTICIVVPMVMALKKSNPEFTVYNILGVNLLFQFFLWVVLVPQIDQYKNSTHKVSKFIQEHAIEESTVLLANSIGNPPSLPFYLGYKFDNIREEKDFNKLYSAYQSDSPHVLVLNINQRDQFLEADPSLEFYEFVSFFTDRKGTSNYYVLMNSKAPLNILF